MSDSSSADHSSRPASPRAFTPTLPSDPPSSTTSLDFESSPYLPPVSTGVPIDLSTSKPLIHITSNSSRSSFSSPRTWRLPRRSRVIDRSPAALEREPRPKKKPTSKTKAAPMAAALSLFQYLRIPIAATGSLVAGLSGLLYWKQNELIYPRHVPPGSRTEVPRPSEFPEYNSMGEQKDSNWEELFVPTPDGETLHGFLLKCSNPKSPARDVTIMMFHGNAGNIGHRLPVAGVLDMHLGCNVVMVEYRGYGLSTGVPDEKGLNIDSQAALDWFRNRDDMRNTKLVLYGQSLGGAVAIQLAARNGGSADIVALVLENTFLSIRKLIPHAFPPAKYLAHLCHQIWPSEETIPLITVPMLFLSGLQDEIIPAYQMKQLHAACQTRHKIFRTFAKGQHNNTVAAPGYFEVIAQFIDEYVVHSPEDDRY